MSVFKNICCLNIQNQILSPPLKKNNFQIESQVMTIISVEKEKEKKKKDALENQKNSVM